MTIPPPPEDGPAGFWRATMAASQLWWLRTALAFHPSAAGPTVGAVDARGLPAYRIAIVGESSAAGVGVASHADGIPGSLARALARSLQRRVEWSVYARPRVSLRRVRQRLIPRVEPGQDLVVLMVGVTEALSATPLEDWSIDAAATIEDLAVRNRRVLVTGIPPFGCFPCVPSPLAEDLDARALAMDAVTEEICLNRPGVTFVPGRGHQISGPVTTDQLFADDGFHASRTAYERWGGMLAAVDDWTGTTQT